MIDFDDMKSHNSFPLHDHASDTLRNGRMSSCTSGSDIDAVQTECSSNHLALGKAETESLMKSKWNHDLSLTTYQCGCHRDPEKATSLLVNNINGVHGFTPRSCSQWNSLQVLFIGLILYPQVIRAFWNAPSRHHVIYSHRCGIALACTLYISVCFCLFVLITSPIYGIRSYIPLKRGVL